MFSPNTENLTHVLWMSDANGAGVGVGLGAAERVADRGLGRGARGHHSFCKGGGAVGGDLLGTVTC